MFVCSLVRLQLRAYVVNCSLVAGFLAYDSVLTRVLVSVGLAYDSVLMQVLVSVGVDTVFMAQSAFCICWDIPNVLCSAF